ncbi:Aste57867_16809 [Aphanomyces stellatus]|uniref:Aste57867_16809 protein n=1 Tax=Aphanomyces stellatus TaxID=120398 RepID=A0A485L735_9STRA|nr:hypothetical protein As57867_016752 [Aphanomyces stellatus]VFT93574.1 Aste57867_16809 [Aphanomyces stellatus]
MDSASEADSEDDWYEYPSSRDGLPCWFSPSRDQRQLVRPNCFAREKSLVGLRVKLFWPFEDTWFEGQIVKFCTSKRKYKIEYMDGDKEWAELDDADPGTTMLFNGGCWLMYENYLPSARALKAALFVNVRVQRYSTAYFAWIPGKVHAYDDATGRFELRYDDGSDERLDLFAHEDDVQVQDRRSLEWMGLGAYFFGGRYDVPPRVQAYLDYDGPYDEPSPMAEVNGAAADETAVVAYGEWPQETEWGWDASMYGQEGEYASDQVEWAIPGDEEGGAAAAVEETEEETQDDDGDDGDDEGGDEEDEGGDEVEEGDEEGDEEDEGDDEDEPTDE